MAKVKALLHWSFNDQTEEIIKLSTVNNFISFSFQMQLYMIFNKHKILHQNHLKKGVRKYNSAKL